MTKQNVKDPGPLVYPPPHFMDFRWSFVVTKRSGDWAEILHNHTYGHSPVDVNIFGAISAISFY